MPAKINSLFYTGAKPWHGLGTKLEKAATAEEAIVAAGLDWKVEKLPVLAQTPAGLKIVPDQYAVTRLDSNTPLGIVGKRFTPLQNKDAFRFFDSVVGVKEAIYHTAGALGDGEKVWILAQLNGVVRTIGDDITEKYLLLANGHDGSLTLQMLFTPIRVVCQNTLNSAIRNAAVSHKLRHTASIGLRVEEVREALGIVNQEFSIFEQKTQKLAGIKVNDAAFKSYLTELGLAPEGDRTEANARSYDRQIEVENLLKGLFQNGKGTELAGVRGTAWGAYNAVTEYVDHFQNPRVKEGKDQVRAKSLLFGAGAELKGEAFDKALALA
jgi:phage/plasmid-like protein (TIGR03299 family)